MAQYYVCTKKTLETLAKKLVEMMLQEGSIVELPGQVSATRSIREKTGDRKRRGQRLSDIIFDNMGPEEFSAKDVFEKISSIYHFRGDRQLDSIRTALKNDNRFDKLEGSLFKKKK